MRCLAFLIFILSAPVGHATPIDPVSLYGNKIEFDVLREGKVVGEHVTRFEQSDQDLYVTSNMNIDIFILFVPVYAFDYVTTEKWVAGKMVSLDANVIDGSDRVAFSARHQGNKMLIEQAGRQISIAPDVLTTNHWNVDVVQDQQVLNTLTGNLNDVTITDKGLEEVMTLNGPVEARRYDYSGDLKDTSVWYDQHGRWVKLRFLARDGSTIEYRCRTCGGKAKP